MVRKLEKFNKLKDLFLNELIMADNSIYIGDLTVTGKGGCVVKDLSTREKINFIEVGTVFSQSFSYPVSKESSTFDMTLFVGYQPQYEYLIKGSRSTPEEVYKYIEGNLMQPRTVFFFSYLDIYGYYFISDLQKKTPKIGQYKGIIMSFEIVMQFKKTSQDPSNDLTGLLGQTAVIGNPQDALSANIDNVKKMAQTGKDFAQKVKDGVTAINHARAKVNEAIYKGKEALDTAKNVLVNISNTVQEVKDTINDMESMYQTTIAIGQAIASGNISSLQGLMDVIDILDYQLSLSYNITNRYSLLNLL